MGPPVRGAGRARRPWIRTEARFHAGAAGVSWAHVQEETSGGGPEPGASAPRSPGSGGPGTWRVLGRARRDPIVRASRRWCSTGVRRAPPRCSTAAPTATCRLGGARRRWAPPAPRLALRQRRPLRPRPRPRGPGRQPRPPVRRLRAGAAGAVGGRTRASPRTWTPGPSASWTSPATRSSAAPSPPRGPSTPSPRTPWMCPIRPFCMVGCSASTPTAAPSGAG